MRISWHFAPLALAAMMAEGSAVVIAQPVLPPKPSAVAAQHAEIRSDVAATKAIKAITKTSALTRQQIQALRLALKAKMAAVRH